MRLECLFYDIPVNWIIINHLGLNEQTSVCKN